MSNHVAMTHMSCPICGKNTNEGILLDKRMKDISRMHNKSTGFSNPCTECQKGIDMGAIMIIVIDESKTTGTKLKDLYRTGNVIGVSEDFIGRIVTPVEMLEDILNKRFAVMDYNVAIQIGLSVVYTP